MRMTRTTSRRSARVVAATMVVMLSAPHAATAAEELSEKSIKSFMDYAWSLVPTQFTKPDGKTITVDKKKKDEVVVPVAVAREVVRVGRLSAHAQVCELLDDQYLNYNSLMRREILKKQWTDQQLLYISQLHLTTVMLLTGKIKLVEKGDDRSGEKDVVVEESKTNTQTCSQEQKAKVKEVITAYVKAGPAIGPAPGTAAAPVAAAPAGAPATTASVPAPAAAPAPAPVTAPAPAADKKK
jgi:hypothetical protein